MIPEHMDVDTHKDEVQPAYIKINSQSIMDLKVRAKIIKIIGENTGVKLHDLRYDTKITSDK